MAEACRGVQFDATWPRDHESICKLGLRTGQDFSDETLVEGGRWHFNQATATRS